jgi:CRP/FNR family transcriptional regulator, cyclic AMP receptor protein
MKVEGANEETLLGGDQMAYRIRVIPKKKRRIMQANKAMKTPYGLEIIESCLTCPMMKDRLFCNLSARTLEGLDAISSSATYPKGAILFVEGQDPHGVFVICNGRVKLSANSTDGKSLILRIADPGEVIGLPGTISGNPYTLTAETLEPIQANFVPRDAFLKFLREHGDAALRVAEILSDIYHATYQEVRYLGLSGSAAEKLARFLLDLAENGKASSRSDGLQRVTLTFTHEEIAQMIGSSRETVTRLLSDFKRKLLVEFHGSSMTIRDKPGLEKILTG